MMSFPEYKISNIRLNIISRQDLIRFLKENLDRLNGYICVTNVRTAYLANKDESYADIQNNSLLTIPDGMPLVWIGKLKGHKTLERTAGPEIFQEVLGSGNKVFRHYLLGDTNEVLTALSNKCKEEYDADIVGVYSPPFLNVEEYDYKEIAKNINDSGANLVWIALGSPKQDIFASKLIPFLENKICMNVGAAFRFVLGEYKMPPKIIQNAGFTGVYWRFFQRPALFLTKYPRYILFILKNALFYKR